MADRRKHFGFGKIVLIIKEDADIAFRDHQRVAFDIDRASGVFQLFRKEGFVVDFQEIIAVRIGDDGFLART